MLLRAALASKEKLFRKFFDEVLQMLSLSISSLYVKGQNKGKKASHIFFYKIRQIFHNRLSFSIRLIKLLALGLADVVLSRGDLEAKAPISIQ